MTRIRSVLSILAASLVLSACAGTDTDVADGGTVPEDASLCGVMPSGCKNLECPPSNCYNDWPKHPECSPICNAAACCSCEAGTWRVSLVDCAPLRDQ